MMVVECVSRTGHVGEMTYNYFYRLIKGQVTLTYGEESSIVQTYGIEIERQDYVRDVMVNIERESINTISPQRHKVHNLLRLIYENEVSPTHLVEVLGEYVDEYINDFDVALSELAYN